MRDKEFDEFIQSFQGANFTPAQADQVYLELRLRTNRGKPPEEQWTPKEVAFLLGQLEEYK